MLTEIESTPVKPVSLSQDMDLFGSAQIIAVPPPKTVIRPQKASTVQPAVLNRPRNEDPDATDEEAINLGEEAGDTSDTFLAKRMFSRMLCDLAGDADADAAGDLFGHIEGAQEQRKQDALIWMFDLNPDGSEVPFTWVCNEIGFDAERVRRITGRSVRQDMKRILKLLSSMVSNEYAKKCELNLMDYCNLSGWQLN